VDKKKRGEETLRERRWVITLRILAKMKKKKKMKVITLVKKKLPSSGSYLGELIIFPSSEVTEGWGKGGRTAG